MLCSVLKFALQKVEGEKGGSANFKTKRTEPLTLQPLELVTEGCFNLGTRPEGGGGRSRKKKLVRTKRVSNEDDDEEVRGGGDDKAADGANSGDVGRSCDRSRGRIWFTAPRLPQPRLSRVIWIIYSCIKNQYKGRLSHNQILPLDKSGGGERVRVGADDGDNEEDEEEERGEVEEEEEEDVQQQQGGDSIGFSKSH